MTSARPAAGREISVFGTDTAGKVFFQTARAVSINGFEVTVEGVQHKLEVNDIVGVRHAGQKGRFQVVWVGRDGTPQQGQVGLRALELHKDIWATSAPSPSRMPAPLSKPSLAGRERRRYPRISCRGSVTFRREGGAGQETGALQVLGEGGCYVETATAAPCFSHLDLFVNAEGLELRALGEVRDSRAGLGMGIAFGEMNPAYLSRLQEWVFQHSRE